MPPDPSGDTTGPTLEFIGTATCLLRLGPFTVLTDPNFLHRGQRAYLGKGLWSRRLTEPSLQPAGLPPLDLVLLSHLHGDHFDRIARRELDRSLPVLSTQEATRQLTKWGFGAAEGLDTWETWETTAEGSTLRVTAVPGVHGPGPAKHLLPPVMGSVLQLQTPGQPLFRMYISGDTLLRPWLRDVVDRTGQLDAAVLHLGGTKVLGLLVTMDGAQGAELTRMLDPRVTVPIHYDDYGVFKSPLQDFLSACAGADLRSQVRPVGRGETVSLR